MIHYFRFFVDDVIWCLIIGEFITKKLDFMKHTETFHE